MEKILLGLKEMTNTVTLKKQFLNKRINIGIFAIACLTVFNTTTVKAFEPVTILVSSLAVVAISKSIDGLLNLIGPSKNKIDAKQRHKELEGTSKEEFIATIALKRQVSKTADREILADHELYKHQAFIVAIKETCPDYPHYIKALMLELEKNPKARIVEGFDTDHMYHKCKSFFKKDAKDYSQFYVLIKNLYAEVLAQEKLLKNSPE